MGGRGKNPYGKVGKLYMFDIRQEVDGVHYTTGVVLSNGGSSPANMFKEVDGGIFPSTQWYLMQRFASLYYEPTLGKNVYGVRKLVGHWGTNSFFNPQEWTATVTLKYEVLNPNNHPIIFLD